MSESPRKPAVFNVKPEQDADSDPRSSAKAKAKEASPRSPVAVSPKAVVEIAPEEDAQRLVSEAFSVDTMDPSNSAKPRSNGFSLLKIAGVAFAGLVSLAIGLAIDSLIRDLFARWEWLGWAALGLTGVFLLGVLFWIINEIRAISRISAITKLRDRARDAYEQNNLKETIAVSKSVVGLYANRADTARGRSELAKHDTEIIDGSDRIKLLERELLSPIDAQAQTLILSAAKRVSVVTAVSPRALIDVGYVLAENARLIRALAELYGGKPGYFGMIRLFRNVVGHLAVTGSIAIGENLMQQVVGHGLAARLSARLGEGVVNGLLTVRIGISAMDLCRPVPFLTLERPGMGRFLSELVSFSQSSDENDGGSKPENN
ncbi:MAG: TIGR01620 family protein [Pseudomonadota bacterium]